MIITMYDQDLSPDACCDLRASGPAGVVFFICLFFCFYFFFFVIVIFFLFCFGPAGVVYY